MLNEILLVKNFPIFLLIFTRIIGIVISSPIFSSTLVPKRIVITLSFFIAIMLFSTTKKTFSPQQYNNLYNFIFSLINEFLIGVSIGIFLNVIFTVFQLSAQYFSFQMGLGISEVLDPMSEIQAPVVAQFYSLFATIIFLSINGLEMIMLVIRKSFELVNYIKFVDKLSPMYNQVLILVRDLFVLSLQLAIPIILTLLIVNIVLGVITKFAPQINIFMIGINIEIVVGFVLIFLNLPFFSTLARRIFNNLFINIIDWLKLLS